MFLDRAFGRGAGLVLTGLAMPLLLGGCFAMQKDLDPIRSDIAVLEKQFVEVQRHGELARRRAQEEPEAPGNVAESLAETRARISAVEKRLSGLEARVNALKLTQPEAAPQPIPPEPVVIEPIEEAPTAPPPVPSAPQPSSGVRPAEELYSEAVTALGSGDYRRAEDGFGEVLSRYPDGRLADNARLGLGETYLARNEYDLALREFERVADDYPSADKVPDALLGAGTTYEKLGQTAKAREMFTRVMDNYPYSDAAKKARKRLETNQ